MAVAAAVVVVVEEVVEVMAVVVEETFQADVAPLLHAMVTGLVKGTVNSMSYQFEFILTI